MDSALDMLMTMRYTNLRFIIIIIIITVIYFIHKNVHNKQ